jgi:signal transduction histidine kinase
MYTDNQGRLQGPDEMIKPTQKRLTVIFTAIIIVFNALILAISFATLNRSMIKSMKNNINNDVRDEFLSYVRSGDFTTLESLRKDEVFQVYNKDGQLVSGTYKFRSFDLPIDSALLATAFSGRQEYGTVRYSGNRYLVSYIPINERYVGRASLALTAMVGYERNFWSLVLVVIPLIMAVSFFVSRYLVRQAMKPIADVFTFQENFSSNVTHELRSPLASLKGNLEVALRKERNADEYRETLRLGLKEVDRIVELINNLYMLASSKFRPLDLLKKEANVREIIEEIVESRQPDILAKEIDLDMAGLTTVTCMCDERLMKLALDNLIDNAIKFTPKGGTINIGLAKKENYLNLTISNTCENINRDEIMNFFEPFYRGENAISRSIEGKGLGLYIAGYIIRSHGGDITIKTSEGNICTIEISQRCN